MGEQHHDFPKTTPLQVILAILGASIAPALVIFLVVKLVLSIQATHIEDGAVSADKVAERIAPVAQVDVAAPSSAPSVAKSGEEVYGATCVACHGSGAMGAPKFQDKASWTPRIAQGYDTLVKHAIEGIRMMPARGGNSALTDTEVANAVVYMANESGADFAPPASAAADEAEAASTDAASTDEEAAPATEAASPAAEPAPAAEAAVPAAKPAGKSGEEVVDSVCMMCHGAGLMGAPKIGDKASWAPRIAQGYETLVQHAIKGVRMMPPKGGNAALTDDEVAAAVAHMANQSGANFTSN